MSDLNVATSSATRPVDDAPLSAIRFVASTLAGVGLAVGFVVAILGLVGRTDWWRGFAAAGAGACLALAMSLAVVLPLFGRSLATLMQAFIVAGVVRAAVLGTIVVVAIRVGGYPENATLALAGYLYAAIFVVEGVVLWHAVSGAASRIVSPDLSREPA